MALQEEDKLVPVAACKEWGEQSARIRGSQSHWLVDHHCIHKSVDT